MAAMKPKHPPLRQISNCFIKPEHLSPETKQLPYHLGPSELAFLSFHYIQKGLLFHKPPDQGDHFMVPLLHRLKNSLSTALFHFYPLSGRLATTTNNGVYVDCVDSPGAKFIHAALDITVSDILSPLHVPSSLIQSLFDLNKAVNYDGRTLPLLSIQVTELLDGVFIASSFNHSLGDGTSFWNFFNMWSEIFQAHGDGDEVISISRPPILERWFPDGYGPTINLPPFVHLNEFEAPELRRRFFHFSAESIANLKAKANAECKTKEISSFQSLSALVWKAITRARCIKQDQITSCRMAVNYRGRLKPALPENYLGNMITSVKADAKAGDLVERGLGWGAQKLHEAVTNITNEKIRESLEKWVQCPCTHQLSSVSNPYNVLMSSSPRFNMYGNKFGMGKAMGVRSGYANTMEGKVTAYPGNEGEGGSVDLEICLQPQTMANLEFDLEFMNAISSPPHFPSLS
ncbi:putative acetyltransferase [Cucumis melo var. makuwa]|uniref:Acetyltransferase n=2 Tax=Cucumis melo TaxID=3656 RepID=A0A5A7V8E1_CUCMM|nr:putative acetyltransferase [Cucumis melo var. makuwa]TYK20184.1 putative acetyltransferase [Cucumis melo var. makuwa]